MVFCKQIQNEAELPTFDVLMLRPSVLLILLLLMILLMLLLSLIFYTILIKKQLLFVSGWPGLVFR